MLNKINRIKKDKEFKKIFSSSRPFNVGKLVFRFYPNRINQIRYGFVISNKIDKRSSRRNSLKRRLRAIARDSILMTKPGYDIIVIVRSNFPYPYQTAEICQEFMKGLKGIGLLNDSKTPSKTN